MILSLLYQNWEFVLRSVE
uniref:Uncharacterized protein n=1 Tax=Arundo donax TaxID=35708 RepID=A0A0A9BC85_ARUDO